VMAVSAGSDRFLLFMGGPGLPYSDVQCIEPVR
jgi:hypothetical protein